MSSNYITNIPKLKGRENFDDWAFAVENLLVLEGADKFIKVEGTEAEAVTDIKARAKIILTIDSSLFVHIKETKTTKELWTKLRALFDDSGFSRRITLLRHLISIRLENSENMTNYVTQIVETSQRLSGTGFAINDEWIGSLLLAGLPERFMPMIMAIEHSGIKITADSIKTKLLDMETVDQSETECNSALLTRHKKKFGKGNTKKNSGHSAQKINESMADTVNNKKAIKCYRCNEIGHYRTQCPLLNEKTDKKKQSNAFSAVFLSGKFSKNDFYVDSGASQHMSTNESWLENPSYSSCLPEIIVANRMKVPVLCSGDVNITTSYNYNITVKDVLCVPTLTTNLLSVSELIKNGNSVVFEPNKCKIRNKSGDLVADADLIDGVYKLNLQTQNCLLTSAVNGETWHRRLGHINSNDMNKMKRCGLVEGLEYTDTFTTSKLSCEVCCEGKQTRLPFAAGSRATEILQIVHSDVCGPMEKQSIGGARYFVLFIDDYSRMTFIYFMKAKSEVIHYFKEFKSMAENFKNTKIKIMRSDNGSEYCSNFFEQYLKNEGIIHQKTNPYTPEQNGLSERSNRTIVEKARCLIYEADLDKKFWAEAANTAVYLKNRSVASHIEKTPFEMWMGRKPDISHLRIFGSPVMVHVPKEKRKKFDKKANKMFLVGYSENTKGYRLFDPQSQKVIVARDVVIMENTCDRSSTTVLIEDQQSPECTDNSKPDSSDVIEADVGDATYIPDETSCESEDSFHDPLSPDGVELVTQSQFLDAPKKRTRRKPDYYGTANMCVEDVTGEQISLDEAMSGPEKVQWKCAINEELKAFSDLDTWELVDRPNNGTVVKNKWVLKKKHSSDGDVRYRARLVAKGFAQRKGIEFTETFSPVLRYSTLRLLFALTVQLNLKMNHLDVPTAFLNGFLDENVFIEIPECFSSLENYDNKVLKLKKAIYGLKQSARAWYSRAEDCLLQLGYRKSKYEPCLFIKCDNDVKMFVALYVDDFFVFYNCKNSYLQLKTELTNKFNIKDLGPIKQCLGMRVNVKKDCITVDQEQFVRHILDKFNMSDCHSSETPMEVNLKLDKDLNNICDVKYPYQQLIGSLMYLSVLTRPDIAYSVSYLSQYNNCFQETHWKHLKRLLKYLQKTKNYGLVFRKNSNSALHGFVDADWASCNLDRRSYSGFCFIMSGCVISYESRKQRTVALSTTESEYMALSEACKEAIYLNNLICDMLQLNERTPISLYSDSQSSLSLAANPLFHKRTKHIDVRHHFVRECVFHNRVKLEHISTSEMPADLLTKSLCSNKHYKFMSLMGVEEI